MAIPSQQDSGWLRTFVIQEEGFISHMLVSVCARSTQEGKDGRGFFMKPTPQALAHRIATCSRRGACGGSSIYSDFFLGDGDAKPVDARACGGRASDQPFELLCRTQHSIIMIDCSRSHPHTEEPLRKSSDDVQALSCTHPHATGDLRRVV